MKTSLCCDVVFHHCSLLCCRPHALYARLARSQVCNGCCLILSFLAVFLNAKATWRIQVVVANALTSFLGPNTHTHTHTQNACAQVQEAHLPVQLSFSHLIYVSCQWAVISLYHLQPSSSSVSVCVCVCVCVCVRVRVHAREHWNCNCTLYSMQQVFLCSRRGVLTVRGCLAISPFPATTSAPAMNEVGKK